MPLLLLVVLLVFILLVLLIVLPLLQVLVLDLVTKTSPTYTLETKEIIWLLVKIDPISTNYSSNNCSPQLKYVFTTVDFDNTPAVTMFAYFSIFPTENWGKPSELLLQPITEFKFVSSYSTSFGYIAYPLKYFLGSFSSFALFMTAIFCLGLGNIISVLSFV